MRRLSLCHAFTLIEVLMAVALCMALAGAATAAYVQIDRTVRRQQGMQEMTIEAAHAYHRVHALALAASNYQQVLFQDSASIGSALKLRDSVLYRPKAYRAVAWKFAVPSPSDLTRGLGVDDGGPEAWAWLEFREYERIGGPVTGYPKYGRHVAAGRYVSRFGKWFFGRSSGHFYAGSGSSITKELPARDWAGPLAHHFAFPSSPDVTTAFVYDLTQNLSPLLPQHYWVFRYDNDGSDTEENEDSQLAQDFPLALLYANGAKATTSAVSGQRPVAIRLRFRITDDPTPDTLDDRARYAEQRIDLTLPLTTIWGSADAP